VLKDLFMRRCMALASKGLGNAAPNPLVGCVIVHNDRIIGEGWHRVFGKEHAEVLAINSVKEKDLLPESTVYVNLEPCSHWGKTPPCADLIIQHKIKKVVISNIDPNSLVDGRGIQKLREAGIEVETGLLEEEGKILNRRFFCMQEKKRPYIILKWAQTADGFIGREAGSGESPQVSGPVSQRLLHKWRSEEAAVMVGTNTAATDNPRLNVRHWSGKDPVRVITDMRSKLPAHLHIFDKSQPTIVLSAKEGSATENLQYLQLLPGSNGEFPSPHLLVQKLYESQLLSVLVEGGAALLNSFISAGLWDEARIFYCPTLFGSGVPAPGISGRVICGEMTGEDRLSIIKPF
jgi:diaminohydroxyphosphoribosylaminopyrimidine deaminase/5-amino-6-(5-phosphoribosylamino)uracil reductase